MGAAHRTRCEDRKHVGENSLKKGCLHTCIYTSLLAVCVCTFSTKLSWQPFDGTVVHAVQNMEVFVIFIFRIYKGVQLKMSHRKNIFCSIRMCSNTDKFDNVLILN